MKKDIVQTVLIMCVLVLCLGIILVVVSDTGEDKENGDEGEVHTHTHNDYVEKSGDTMTGDLVVENLHANEGVLGDGSGLRNLNASMINSGTIAVARLPSNIDADTIDGLDSAAFSLALHDHDGSYYTKIESDAKYALDSHSHPSTGDADTLDGLDSTDFTLISHDHDPSYYLRTEVDSSFLGLSGGTLTGDLFLPNLYASGIISGDGSGLSTLNASMISSGTISIARLPSNINADTVDGMDSSDFASSIHNHDTRYYQQFDVDANFLHVDGGTLTGDLYLPNLVASGMISGDGSTLTNLNASSITSGTIGIARLPPNINADTLDNYDSTNFVFVTDFSIHSGNPNTHHIKYTDAEAVAACSGIYAPIAHTHNATDITEGELAEDRLPQDSIDDTEIETGFGLVPSGTIVMWNGTTIPNGWALCDGTNGTPDLRGMFIVGYDPNDPDYNVIGLTGGEKNHLLLTSEMPAHTHSVTGSTSTDGDHNHGYDDRYGTNTREVTPAIGVQVRDIPYTTEPKTTNNAGDHTHTVTGSALTTGGSQAHENRPPYYVLAFIMKL
jgi:microcystin-dependent protein